MTCLPPGPEERARLELTALRLMRLALALLDRAGELRVAARLQAAVDAAEGRGRGLEGEAWTRIVDEAGR